MFREILADGDTPVSAYAKLGGHDYGFLLESVVGGATWAAYSFIGATPRACGPDPRGRGRTGQRHTSMVTAALSGQSGHERFAIAPRWLVAYGRGRMPRWRTCSGLALLGLISVLALGAASAHEVVPREQPVVATAGAPEAYQAASEHGVKSQLIKKALQLVARGIREGSWVIHKIIGKLDKAAAKAFKQHAFEIAEALETVARIRT